MASPSSGALVKLSSCHRGHLGPLTGTRSPSDSCTWYPAKNLSQKGMCLLGTQAWGWGGGVFSSCHLPSLPIVIENKLFLAVLLLFGSLKQERGRGVQWKGKGKQKCSWPGQEKDPGISHGLLRQPANLVLMGTCEGSIRQVS